MRPKVRIKILDDEFETDAEDTVLFALQRYGQARNLPLYGFTRFCWNSSCRQCVVKLQSDELIYRDFACQTPVTEDLHILSLPRVLHWVSQLLGKTKI